MGADYKRRLALSRLTKTRSSQPGLHDQRMTRCGRDYAPLSAVFLTFLRHDASGAEAPRRIARI